MVEVLLTTLIWVGIIVGCVFLVLWALRNFGLSLPPRVIQIGWVIAVLVIILILWRGFGSSLPGI